VKKPREGDGLAVERCNGCGGLSVVMLEHGEPIAYICPSDETLIQLAGKIIDMLIAKPDADAANAAFGEFTRLS